MSASESYFKDKQYFVKTYEHAAHVIRSQCSDSNRFFAGWSCPQSFTVRGGNVCKTVTTDDARTTKNRQDTKNEIFVIAEPPRRRSAKSENAFTTALFIGVICFAYSLRLGVSAP